jgi:hypothetical protein
MKAARMSRQTLFIGMTPTLRLRIETTIENLLLLLDEIDGDENLEPDHAGFDQRTMDDREEDHDFEPSLGCSNDLELDHCDHL